MIINMKFISYAQVIHIMWIHLCKVGKYSDGNLEKYDLYAFINYFLRIKNDGIT